MAATTLQSLSPTTHFWSNHLELQLLDKNKLFKQNVGIFVCSLGQIFFKKNKKFFLKFQREIFFCTIPLQLFKLVLRSLRLIYIHNEASCTGVPHKYHTNAKHSLTHTRVTQKHTISHTKKKNTLTNSHI